MDPTSTSLAPAPTHVALGAPARWARDFAFVGLVSAFLAPFLVTGLGLGVPTLAATTLAGGATGAVVGLALERALRGPLGALHPLVQAALMAAIGGLWGVVVGVVGGVTFTGVALGLDLTLDHVRSAPSLAVTWFAVFAAVAAAAQLAWFGPAYAHLARRGGPTWPLLIGAAGTPCLGWAALMLTM